MKVFTVSGTLTACLFEEAIVFWCSLSGKEQENIGGEKQNMNIVIKSFHLSFTKRDIQ